MIAEASGGIPRTINILCDTALVYGFACGVPVITEEIVASVIDNKNRFGVLPISMPAD
jgi:type II secretory pathway predicted ATPase ExeA